MYVCFSIISLMFFFMTTKKYDSVTPYGFFMTTDKNDSVTPYILFDKDNSVTPYVFLHDDQ